MSREITEPKVWQSRDEALDYLLDQAGNIPVDTYVIDRVVTSLVSRYKRYDKSLKPQDFVTIETTTACYGDSSPRTYKWVTLGRGQGIDLAKVSAVRKDSARSYENTYQNRKARELDIFPGFVMDDAGMNTATFTNLLRVVGELESATLLSDHVRPTVTSSADYESNMALYGSPQVGLDGLVVTFEASVTETGYKNSFRPCVSVNPLWVAGNGLLNLPVVTTP